MKRLHAFATGLALALAITLPAFAEPASTDVSDPVMGDMIRALNVRSGIIRAMAAAPSGEAVLGEQATPDQLTDQILQEMLAQLEARARLTARLR